MFIFLFSSLYTALSYRRTTPTPTPTPVFFLFFEVHLNENNKQRKRKKEQSKEDENHYHFRKKKLSSDKYARKFISYKKYLIDIFYRKKNDAFLDLSLQEH